MIEDMICGLVLAALRPLVRAGDEVARGLFFRLWGYSVWGLRNWPDGLWAADGFEWWPTTAREVAP